MTKNKLKNSFIFKVVVAALITTAIIFLPAAVLAEGDVDTVDGSTTSGGFDTGGIEAGGTDFGAAPDTTTDFGGGPAADLSTPGTDSNPLSQTSDQQSDLQEPMPSDTTDTGDESGEADGLAIEATTDSTGSTVDQLGASSDPAVNNDTGSDVTTEASASNQTQYFQVVEESMNPLFSSGAIVEIVSENYAEGDIVVAQTADGINIIKMLVGDQLVSLGAGTNYAAAEVTILGAVAPSAMSQAELESSGIAWNSALATTSTEPAGSGTSGSPYQIAIWQNLYWLSQTSGAWDKYFEQTADITFPGDHVNKTDGGYIHGMAVRAGPPSAMVAPSSPAAITVRVIPSATSSLTGLVLIIRGCLVSHPEPLLTLPW
jgi:hypothetical protein